MAFHHRKMLVSCLEIKNFNLTIFVNCFQTYPPPPPPPQSDLSLAVTTSICVVGSVSLLLSLAVFLYLYIMQQRRNSAVTVAHSDTNRRPNEDETGERDFYHAWRIPTVGFHRSTIDSIAVVKFKKEEGIIDDTECSVCLIQFEENESLRVLPKCSHAFHINCIDTWLLSHKNCPLCRASILLTKPNHQETETNHLQDSGSSNNLSRGQEISGSRKPNFLSRAQSDLANHCGSGSIETLRRSLSIGGRYSLCNDDDIATRSRRHVYTSFSPNVFTSSRRSRSQEPVLPNRMPSVSVYTA